MRMPSVLDVDDIQRITSDYFGGHKCWRVTVQYKSFTEVEKYTIALAAPGVALLSVLWYNTFVLCDLNKCHSRVVSTFSCVPINPVLWTVDS